MSTFRFNRPQKLLAFFIQFCNLVISIWGRGTGKSTIIAWLIHMINKHLAGTKWLIVGETYRAMLENTLPSTIAALKMFGYHRDVHYVVGVKPPKSFKEPIEPPTKGWSNTITFFTGNVYVLVSQDSAATSARGLNTDGSIVDEALRLNKEKYDEEVSGTIRANQQNNNFRKVPFHLGEFFFSSRPYGAESNWLYDASKYYAEDQNDYEYLKISLVELQIQFIKSQSMKERAELWEAIQAITKDIRYYAKGGVYYSESNAFDNIQILGVRYLERRLRKMTSLAFMVEILNHKVTKVEGGFYANFERIKHTYKGYWTDDGKGQFNNNHLEDRWHDKFDLSYFTDESNKTCLWDRDCIPTEPLVIGVDWGANINSMVVGQKLDVLNQFNFINAFHAKSPEILDAVFHAYAKYYAPHPTKVVYFAYDRNGNNRVANSKLTFAEQGASILESYGWEVIFITEGLDAYHEDKYYLWNVMLAEVDEELPRVRWNAYNCKDVVLSIEASPVKEKDGHIKKDKSSEGKHLATEEHATHYGDACDVIIDAFWGDYAEERARFISPQFRG